MKPVRFRSPGAFREWLAANHDRAAELRVAFHTMASGRGGMTYPEALDEALCHGWIDGLRRSMGDEGYEIRFTPRRSGSIWSLVNVRHAHRLVREGRMAPAGLRVFEARNPRRTGLYSFESKPRALPASFEEIFRKDSGAWAHWSAQPPGYRRTATFWVVSAVREETRLRRLGRLVSSHAAGSRIDLLI